MRNKLLGAIAISIAAMLWGIDGVVLTPGLYQLDVSFVVFMFHAIPFLLMSLIFADEFKKILKFTFKDVFLFSLVSVFGGAIGTLSIVKALFLMNFEHLTIVALIQKLQPVFAIFMAYIFLRERMPKHFYRIAAIAIISGYFLTFGLKIPMVNIDKKNVLAGLFALIAAFAFGSSTVFSKRILRKYSFKTTTFYRYAFTAIFMFFYVLLNGKLSLITQLNMKQILLFIIIAFTTGSGAIFLYYFGLKRVKAMVSTICELWFPVTAIILDYYINGSVLSVLQWISAIVMIGSILLLSWSQS